MKILITGGAGFIGSHVAASYLRGGHTVAIADNLTSGRLENIPENVAFYRADIADHAQVDRIFGEFRPEVVSHHAAQMDIRRSLREPLFDASVNVLGSLSVLEAAVRHGAKKFIFASSGGAIYGEPPNLPADESTAEHPISHYGVAKLCVERYLHAYQRLYALEFVSLRYANVFGPRQNPYGEAGVVSIFIGQMLTGEVPTIFGDGTKTRDYVFVEDVAKANLLVLDKSVSGTFNVGCGVQVSDFEIFRAIRQQLGFEYEPKFAPSRLGEVTHISLNAKAAARAFGWKPSCSLGAGIARTIAYVRPKIERRAAFRYGRNLPDQHGILDSSEFDSITKAGSQR